MSYAPPHEPKEMIAAMKLALQNALKSALFLAALGMGVILSQTACHAAGATSAPPASASSQSAPAASAPAASAPTPAQIKGAVWPPVSLTPKVLKALPALTLSVHYKTTHGDESGVYKGISLWGLLQRLQIINGMTKNADLQHTVIVMGRDGYAIALSFGELDPHLGDDHAIVAYAGSNHTASFSNLRLILPEDHYGARDVRDIAEIDIR